MSAYEIKEVVLLSYERALLEYVEKYGLTLRAELALKMYCHTKPKPCEELRCENRT